MYPKYVTATVVEMEQNGRSKPCPLYLRSIVGGVPKSRRLLYTLPGQTEVWVAPGGHSLVYNEPDYGSIYVVLRYVNLVTGTSKRVCRHYISDTFVQWSPDNRSVLFQRTDAQHGTSKFFLVRGDSMSRTEVMVPNDDYPLNVLWDRRGHKVITSTVKWSGNKVFQSARTDVPPRYYAQTLPSNARSLVSDQPRLLGRREVEKAIGISVLAAMQAWRKDSFDNSSFDLTRALPPVMSWREDKTLIFGSDVRKEVPGWASPDRKLVYIAAGTTVKRKLIAQDSSITPSSIATWSKNDDYVHYLSDQAWVWLNTHNAEQSFFDRGSIVALLAI